MKNLSNDKETYSITFYVIHLPILLLLVAVLFVSGFVSFKVTDSEIGSLNEGGSVLSEGNVEFENTDTEIKTDEINGEPMTEYRLYEIDGNKMEFRMLESIDTDEKIKDFILKTKDGKLDLRIRKGKRVGSTVKLYSENRVLEIRNSNTEPESVVIIKASGDRFRIVRNGEEVWSKFPLVAEASTGKVFVNTPQGEFELIAMPDVIKQKALDEHNLEEVYPSVLNVLGPTNENIESVLEYRLTGAKSERFLGAINVKIPAVLSYDAETGELLDFEISFVNRVLDLFSF